MVSTGEGSPTPLAPASAVLLSATHTPSAASSPRFTRAAYTISFQCEPPSACNNFHDEVQVTVRSDVKELVLGDGFESPLPEQTIALDTRFDSIKTVRVVNLNGTAAVGKRVRVFSYGNVQMIPLAVPDSVVIPGLTHIENDMMQALDVNKLATFDGGSALTDEEGIARFPNLTISGYAGPTPYVIMRFYARGRWFLPCSLFPLSPGQLQVSFYDS